MAEIDETSGIKAAIILEVMGKPPEHLIETLNKIIDEIEKEEGVEIKQKKVNQPIPMKEKTDILGNDTKIKENEFYTNFAEIEVEVDQISRLVLLMFKYMPANIEIIYPEAIILTNNGWGDILSEITRRLHANEEIVRVLQIQKAMLEKKLSEQTEKGK